MVPGGFSWFFMIPGCFLWFQVGFSRFQVSFHSFRLVLWLQVDFSLSQVGFMGFHGSRSVFRAFHSYRSTFHDSKWTFMFFNGSSLGFHDSRSVFMISGWFLWFSIVDWFIFKLSAGGAK